MKITNGIFEHMVMQRNADNVCEQKICGETRPDCEVAAILPGGGKQLIARSDENGFFCGFLKGLQAGGPYRITLTDGVSDAVFTDLLVGDVWILAGQSNMQGVGKMSGALPPRNDVRAFYLDDRWDTARDPLHNMNKAKAEIHWTLNGGHHAFDNCPEIPLKGVGPGVAFGQAMAKKTSVPQGLIASAHGGTTLKLWNPELKDKGENSLYGAMLRRFVLNGEKIAGVLWYQGCSDTADEETVESYSRNTLNLFSAMRRDFRNPELPIVLAQLGRNAVEYDFARNRRWSQVREQQRLLAENLENCAMVPAIDLECDDEIHLSGKAQAILGKRMADAMAFLKGCRNEKPPLKIGKIEYAEDTELHEYRTTIQVENVVGVLHCNHTLPMTFSLHRPCCGSELAAPPFRCELDGSRIIVSAAVALGCKVSYGFGCNGFGNVYDEAGRALPAFGPLFSHQVFRSTPMLSKVEVSEPIMGEDRFPLLLPEKTKMEQLHFSEAVTSDFYFTFERILEKGDYYRFVKWHCFCRRKINCRLLLGSDSNFRLLCDGKEILSSDSVENPIVPDEFMQDLTLDTGEHEFVMGLSGKAGNAWGFCFRIVDTNDILTEDSEKYESENLPVFM